MTNCFTSSTSLIEEEIFEYIYHYNKTLYIPVSSLNVFLVLYFLRKHNIMKIMINMEIKITVPEIIPDIRPVGKKIHLQNCGQLLDQTMKKMYPYELVSCLLIIP